MNKILLTCAIFVGYFSTSVVAKNNASKSSEIFVAPANLTDKDYAPKTILFKIKEDYRDVSSISTIADAQLVLLFNKLGIDNLGRLFPHAEKPKTEMNELGQKYADLTLTYQLRYTSETNVIEAINQLLATGKVEYAEPKYIHKLHFTPNDPNISNQNAWLTRINAYNAWNISTGDTNVVIGIVDSGTDIDHPDLVANLKINYSELPNGIDDDNDGYIDNFQGWDISEDDNNPNVDNSDHGSHVSGCAAAVTNNGVGVASPSFKCKFLPVKCAKLTSTTSIDNGYEGIVYAADHGCNIINCSWGGSFSGATGQAAITYATINKNCLVLASAGNDNADLASFPAAFQYVTSVAATTNSDIRASFSTYNYTVDVSAPGNNIYATLYDNTYGNNSGTSMSSPIAAGAAAIIKSVFPTYSALQIGEQLRVTCTDIYNISFNGNYISKLGKGRINMGNSLTQTLPSVRMEPIHITDNNDDAFVATDTLRIAGNFTNYLAATNNCTVTLSAQTNSQYITIINGTYIIGALATLATTNNNGAAFKVLINANTPANTKILFKLTYVDGSTYSDFQAFEVIANVDYINVTINNIATTITSKGRICYNADTPTQGLGFAYNDTSMAYECGLMIGASNTQVVNNIRSTGTTPNNDFKPLVNVSRNATNPLSDFDLFGTFDDSYAISTALLNVKVNHKSFAWNEPGQLKYVIVEYYIKNKSTSALNNLYAGIFTDWDIQNYATNMSAQNPAIKLGYAYSNNSSKLYAGVKVLTSGAFNMYAVDNVTGGVGGMDLSDGFDTSEKYAALSTSRAQAGVGNGSDVINIVSTGPYNLSAGDSVKVAFALLAGDDLIDLETSAANAQIKYDNLNSSINETTKKQEYVLCYPNPAATYCKFAYDLKKSSQVTLSLYDASGKLVKIAVNAKQSAGQYTLSIDISQLQTGLYSYVFTTDNSTTTNKINIIR